MQPSQFTKYEGDGWFWVAYTPETYGFSDDLGTCAAQTTVRFRSPETREYYIQARMAEAKLTVALHQRDCLIRGIEAALKKHGIRKALAKLVEAYT